MTGQGEYAALIRKRFDLACRRFGLDTDRTPPLDTTQFRPSHPAQDDVQGELF